VISLFWRPNATARSAIQHFAAGAVLAAVATSVVPEAGRIGTMAGVLSGFAIGGLAMIGLKWLVAKSEHKKKAATTCRSG
jgi:hypothetical protein